MSRDSNIFELITVASRVVTRIAEHNQHVVDEGQVPTGLDYVFVIKALRELAEILVIDMGVVP